ncbi:tyrosine recombinase XerC [Alphaproteobacteria bacterium]|nr:tyrosine recombinase XerC [Alphaproteobacteria bacterium]
MVILEKDLGLKELAKNWLSYLFNSEFLSKNTVDAYEQDLALLVEFLEYYKSKTINREDLLFITKQEIRSWILFKKNKGNSDKSCARGLSAIKNFLKFCIKNKLIEHNDITDMKAPKIRKNLPRPIAIDKINDILGAIYVLKKTDWIIKRDRVLLFFVYSVGLRINEALSLNKSEVLDAGEFISVFGKGGKARMVPIVDKARELILDYIKSSGFEESKALFVNRFGERLSASAVQKLVKKAREMLDLPDSVTPHALRHSCATHIIESGGDLRSVQELLGHASISSTQIYSAVAKSHLLDVYDKCHPMRRKRHME